MPVKLVNTPLDGLYELQIPVFEDHRGMFFNLFKRELSPFNEIWADLPIAQINLSRTNSVGTVRGLHCQLPPYQECKLVRCLSGCIWDVAVDLRVDSKSYGCWHSIKLSSSLGNAVFIPKGFAHGFQSLEPNSEVLYLHSGSWVSYADHGVRFDDPKLNIDWPLLPINLSKRDLSLPFLS